MATSILSLVSFPKSGRTWLRVMLDDVGIPHEYSHDESGHQQRRPLAELNPDKTRYSHRNILLLVRDPRDTAVSGFFQITRRLSPSDRSLSEVLRDEHHGIRKICHFNLQWFAAATQVQQFAILSYEQMKQAPAKALTAVAARAGRTLDIGTAQRIAEDREFSRMHAAEANGELGAQYGDAMLPKDRGDRQSFKVRRGVVGGYTDYFSESDLAYCEDVFVQTSYWKYCDQAFGRWGLLRSAQTTKDGPRAAAAPLSKFQPPR